LQFGDEVCSLLGSQAMEVQVLVLAAIGRRQTGAGSQELGVQFGDRLRQRHRVGVHRPGQVIGYDRPVMLCRL
jgi:hypothetical protein